MTALITCEYDDNSLLNLSFFCTFAISNVVCVTVFMYGLNINQIPDCAYIYIYKDSIDTVHTGVHSFCICPL